MERQEAMKLLQTYNQEPFHIRHALTVEAVMRYFAKEEGLSEEEIQFWGFVRIIT